MKVNGKNYTKNYIDYATLTNGANINIVMDSKPNTSRGTLPSDAPYSMSKEKK